MNNLFPMRTTWLCASLSYCLTDFPFPVELWHTATLYLTIIGKVSGLLWMSLLFIKKSEITNLSKHITARRKIQHVLRRHCFKRRIHASSRLVSALPLRGLNHAAQRSLSNLWALVPVSSPRPPCLQRALYKACFMQPGSVALRGNGH